jgi:CxxC motif-containing protein
VATSRKILKVDTCVSCPMCSCEIPLHSALRLPREFSVRCQNCGQRKIYGSAEVHDRKEDAKVTHIFREIQFGTREDIRPT